MVNVFFPHRIILYMTTESFSVLSLSPQAYFSGSRSVSLKTESEIRPTFLKNALKPTGIITSACQLHFNSFYKSNSDTVWEIAGKKPNYNLSGKTQRNLSYLEWFSTAAL